MEPASKSRRVRRPSLPATLPLVAALIVSLLLSACAGPLDPQPTPTPAPGLTPEIQAQPQPPNAQTATPTVVIPGMPACPTPVAAGTPSPVSNVVPVIQPSSAPPFVIYSGGKLADNWENASWGTNVDFSSSEAQRDGKPTIKVQYTSGWSAFSVADWQNKNNADTSKYSHLHFWVNGGSVGGQLVGVTLGGARLRVDKYLREGAVPANRWQEVFIPLDALEAGGAKIGRINFQEVSGNVPAPYYLDGIEFYKDATPPATPIVTNASVTVDVGANRQPISPLIYGMSVAPEEIVREANASINRLGGNPYSRYNWELGSARNAGSDWEYRNYSREGSDPAYKRPSGMADLFFQANKRTGAETILTVPLLGYVAKDDDNNSHSTGVPEQGGPAVSAGSEAIPGYDPTANQRATSVRSHPRKGVPFADPPEVGGDVYQDEWVNHLVRTFGQAANGGVRFYSMDNEPDLWADNTHLDVHPVRPGYDGMLSGFLEYARAVKAVDPTAQVTGPVVSGWTGYWYSALDRGSDSFRTHADRRAHGNTPFIPWFLDQVRRSDEAAGGRTLDVLDIHYYPQAENVYSDKVGGKISELRLRSTRSLWDPTYEDESWIARTEAPQVQLIPRMKEWIAQNYPGTKLGITEWNWGAEGTMNGALAIAEVLGIYGREGVYLATYFTNPPAGSPGLNAFKMYRNYDGQERTFGDVSVAARSSNNDKLSVFASEDTQTNQIKIMVLNKTERESMATRLDLRGANLAGPAKVYSLGDHTGLTIKPLPDAPVSGAAVSYTFPPYSVTLLVIDKAR